MAELAESRKLERFERKAIEAAHLMVLREFESARRVPVLEDFVSRLHKAPDDHDFKGMPPRVREEFELAAWKTKFMFEELQSHSLAGLFDGEDVEACVVE